MILFLGWKHIQFVYTAWLVCSILSLLLFTSSVSGLSRGYETNDAGVQSGMVVSLVDNGEGRLVERASQPNQDKVVGVVTTASVSSITVASDATDILVETDGDVDVYVSDLNGEVTQGDLLVLSPLKGILMKAPQSTTSTIIGVVVSGDSKVDQITYQVDDRGNKRDTKVSRVKANLNRLGAASGAGEDDSALQKLGRAIVGREVSSLRVFFALVVFTIVLVAEGGIIYGAVSSAVIALGRNPMARKVIQRQLAQVAVIAIGVLIIGLASVYSMLWL